MLERMILLVLDWFMNLPDWKIALIIVWIIFQIILFLMDVTELMQKSESYPIIVQFFKDFKGIMVYHIVLFILFFPYWIFCGVVALIYLFFRYPVYWLFLVIERIMTTPVYAQKKK